MNGPFCFGVQVTLSHIQQIYSRGHRKHLVKNVAKGEIVHYEGQNLAKRIHNRLYGLTVTYD